MIKNEKLGAIMGNKYKLLLILISISFNYLNYLNSMTTTQVAIKNHYFEYAQKLRSIAMKHLKDLEDHFSDIVDRLRAEGHHQLANEKVREFREIYKKVDEDFNRRFNVVDQLVAIDGEHLDEDNVSIGRKKALVTKAKKTAKLSVDQAIIDSIPNPYIPYI